MINVYTVTLLLLGSNTKKHVNMQKLRVYVFFMILLFPFNETLIKNFFSGLINFRFEINVFVWQACRAEADFSARWTFLW